MTKKIAFIGGGNMAKALISGLLKQSYLPSSIYVIDINPQVLNDYAQQGITVSEHIDERLGESDVWVLAVKPQQLKEVTGYCRPFLKNTLVISIAAGVTTEVLGRYLGDTARPWQRIVRAMPNTPALVGAGATGLFASLEVGTGDKELATTLFDAVGMSVWVRQEQQLEAVTAVSGSGPAYIFYILEAMIKQGTLLGLESDVAIQLAYATAEGAAKLAQNAPQDVETLRHQVTSKGGTTAAAIACLDEHRVQEAIAWAMQACADRAREMAVEFSS